MLDNLPDLERILKKALSRRGSFAEIFVERRASTTIIFEDGKLENIVTGLDIGAGLRVIHGLRSAYGYTNDLSFAAMEELASAVSLVAREGRAEVLNLARRDYPSPCPMKRPVDEVSLTEKVAVVERSDKAARAVDRRIRQVRVAYMDMDQKVVVANSKGLLTGDRRRGLTFYVHVTAAKEGVLQTGYEPVGGTVGFEFFSEVLPEEVALRAAKRALLMLEARKAPGGTMPVVLSNEAGGTMIHEAVGHGLEADLALQGLSVYSGKIGQKIASSLITVVDDATLPNRRGSFAVDDEGTPSQRTVLIEKGVLKSYMYDLLSAMKSGAKSTGNGRRQSYRHQPIPRMTNTFIVPGETPSEEILKATDDGLYVVKMGGGQVNTVNGDFVFEVNEGYLIERGELGEPVRGATLTGNGPRILMEIDMVGNDLGFGIGTCGKDGQGVPVSDAQPTLRIPEMVVGGEVQK